MKKFLVGIAFFLGFLFSTYANAARIQSCYQVDSSYGSGDTLVVTTRFICQTIDIPVNPGAGGLSGERGGGGGGGGGGRATKVIDKPTNSDLSCDDTDHPVIVATGNKVLPQNDILTRGDNPLRLDRNYSKVSALVGSFGTNWPSTLDYKLQFSYADGSSCTFSPGGATTACPAGAPTIYSVRPSGTKIKYMWNAGQNKWLPNEPSPLSNITTYAGGYLLNNADNSVEKYGFRGQISSVANEFGVVQIYIYTGSLLASIQHENNRSITFTWQNNKLKTAQNAQGGIWTYGYNANGMLSSVLTPVGDTTTYHYESTSQVSALTGVSYNNERYSRVAYYTNGKVQNSGLEGGVEKSSFVYASDGSSTTVTNAGGAVSKHYYDSAGRLTSLTRTGVTGCPNASVATLYDANGHIYQETDAAGNISYSKYAANGQLLATKMGSGTDERTTSYVWDPGNNRITTVNVYPVGSTYYTTGTGTPIKRTSYTYYDSSSVAVGRVKSITETNLSSFGIYNQARTTTYTYTIPTGKHIPTQVVIDGPVAGTQDAITSNYTVQGDLVSVSNGLGQTTTYGGFSSLGQAGVVTDPNGFSQFYGYDASGRLDRISSTVNGQQRVTTYEYTPLNQVSHVGQTPSGLNQDVNYDDQGRLESIYDNNSLDKVEYGYNLLSKVTSVTGSHGGGISYNIAFDKYDEAGNRIHVPIDADNNRTLVYDAKDRVVSSTGVLLDETAYTYNAFDQVKTIKNPEGFTSSIAYDSFGKVQSITDFKGLTTTYRHDSLGNLTQVISPDGAGFTASYYSDGNVQTITRTGGGTISFGYDGLGRIKAKSGTDYAVFYVYDSCQYGIGRLCEISSESGDNVAYEYTVDGNLAKQTSTIAGNDYITSWTYDSLGNVKTVTYPTGNIVTYSYDSSGRVNNVDVTVGSQTNTFVSNFGYVPFGPRYTMTFGNNEQRYSTYDTSLRLRRSKTTNLSNTSTVAQDWSYDYDGGGRIFRITNNLDSDLTQTLGYDSASRLISDISGAFSESWDFDSNGNRKYQVIDGTATTFSISSTSNHILGTSALTYGYSSPTLGSSAVTSVSGGSNDFVATYDAGQQLKAIGVDGLLGTTSTTSYEYDGRGLRSQKISPAGFKHLFIYGPNGELLQDGDALTMSLASSQYIYLEGEIIGLIRNGLVYYVLNDQVGRPEMIRNSLHGNVWKADNHPYDRDVTLNLIGGFNIGFPGQYLDTESGLYYNINRYYDPSTGRYLQADPIGLIGGPNLYAYVGGNPISFADPTGLFCIPDAVIGGLSGAAGGAAAGAYAGFLTGQPGLIAGGAILGGIGGGAVGVAGSLTSSASANYAIATGAGTMATGSRIERGAGGFGALFGATATSAMQASGYSSGVSNIAGSTLGGATGGAAAAILGGGSISAAAYIGGASGAVGAVTAIAVSSYLNQINATFGDCGCGK